LVFGIWDFAFLKPPAKADVKRYSIHRFELWSLWFGFWTLDFWH